MPTVSRTWVFAATTEGLADVGDSANIPVNWDATPQMLEFGPATGGANDTERARGPVTAGNNWTALFPGLPAGATVTDVNCTAYNYQRFNSGSITSYRVRVRIVDSAGVSVHSAGELVDQTISGSGTDVSKVAGTVAGSRAVDAAKQAAATLVALEVQLNRAGGAASNDFDVDDIAITVTYTTGFAGPAIVPEFMRSTGPWRWPLFSGFDRALTLRIRPVFAATDFSLTADPGVHDVTGVAADTIADRLVTADPGTYAVTGTAAQTVAGRIVDATAGSYTLTGVSTSLLADRMVTAVTGAYVVSGTAAASVADRFVAAAPGVYTVSGVAADLVYGTSAAYVLNADTGGYTITGVAVDPLATRLIGADLGSYTLTGTAATVAAGRVIVAATGSYATSGVAAGTLAVRMVSADPGAYTIGGTPANLVYSGAPIPTLRPIEDIAPVFVTL